jgi:hypothetical protein
MDKKEKPCIAEKDKVMKKSVSSEYSSYLFFHRHVCDLLTYLLRGTTALTGISRR